MQTYFLEASQGGLEQSLIMPAGSLCIVGQPEAGPLEETLVASRSGEDLALTLRSEESAQPALTLKDFFANNGKLHILRSDKEMFRGITAQDNPEQGPVKFSALSLETAERQALAPALELLHESAFPEATAVSPSQASLVMEPAAFSMLAAAITPTIDNALDQLGARQGSLATGGVTDDKFSVLEGTGAAGSVLEIVDGDEVIGEVTVGSDGRWRFEPEVSLSEGGHVFSAHAKDGSGASNAFVLVIDSVAPKRAVIDEISDDTSGVPQKIAKGAHTADSTPLIEGKAEAFSMVALYNGKTLIGTTFADAQGNWSFASFFNWPDGEYKISAQAIDFSGNTGLSSVTYQFTIDTIPPAAPVITQAFDDFGAQQGVLGSGDQTDDSTPTLSGISEANAIVEIFDNGTKIGDTRADAQGNWTFTPSFPLVIGSHSLTTRATDQAGNKSGLSDAFNLTIKNDAPGKPGLGGEGPGLGEVIDDQGSIQGPIEQGGVTDDSKPTLKGNGNPGDTIIINDNGTKIGEVEVGEDGTWEFTPETDLGDGDHGISVIIQDPAGNQSEPSDEWVITVDTQAPEAPAIGSVLDDVGAKTGELTTGDVTDDQQPAFSGTAEAGATVVIYDNGVEIGRVVAENGTWAFTPEQPLAEGEHSITVQAIDTAGNVSEPSEAFELVVDTTAPEKPVNGPEGTGIGEIIDDQGSITGPIAEGGVTDDSKPTLRGQGNPGDTIIIFDNGTKIGEVEIGESGTWEFTPETDLGDGEHGISVIIQDPVGNQSEPSDEWVLTVDTQAPTAPTIDSITDDVSSVTGSVDKNGMTDDTKPTLAGKAEANATVTIKNGTTVLGSVLADASGNWSFTPQDPLSLGNHAFTATATDAAGNVSDSSTAYNITVAMRPTITHAEDTVGSITGNVPSGGVSDDNRITLRGKVAPGSTVKVNNLDGEYNVDANGNWSFKLAEGWGYGGTATFKVKAYDSNGKMYAESEPYSITFDFTKPDAPTIDSITDDVSSVTGSVDKNGMTDDTKPTLAGKAEANATVTIKNGTTVLGSVLADASGNWSFTPQDPLSLGNHTFTATATDAAGNVSDSSTAYNITVAMRPTITHAEDTVGSITGNVPNGGVSDDNRITLRGKVAPGSTVRVNNLDGEYNVDANGNWSFKLAEGWGYGGTFTFKVKAYDSNGKMYAESEPYSITFDFTKPDAPTIDSITDDVSSVTGSVDKNGMTDDTKPTLAGKAEANATVTIKNGTTVLGSVLADASGNWSFTPQDPLSLGNHTFTATATDAVGNVSDSSTAYNITVAMRPTITHAEDTVGSITGNVPNGGVSDDNRITLRGKVAPGSTVRVNNLDGEYNVDANGNWSFKLAEGWGYGGTATFNVKAYDSNGKMYAESEPYSITFDFTKPDVPEINSVLDNVGAVTGNIAKNGITDDLTPTLKGKAEAGSHVTIMSGSKVIGVTTATAQGDWEFTPGSPLAMGHHSFTVIARDAAGNSASSTSYPILIENDTAPGMLVADFHGQVDTLFASHGDSGLCGFQIGHGGVGLMFARDYQIGGAGGVSLKVGGKEVNGMTQYHTSSQWWLPEDYRGQTSYISMKVGNVDSAGGGVHFYDKYGNHLGGVSLTKYFIKSGTPWEANQVNFTAPDGRYIDYFVIHTKQDNGVNVDGIRLYKNSTPSPMMASLEDDIIQAAPLMLLDSDTEHALSMDINNLPEAVKGESVNEAVEPWSNDLYRVIENDDGMDTLLLDGKNLSIELDSLLSYIGSIDKIDLGDNSANSLSLNASAMENLGQTDMLLVDGKNQLVINGDDSNSIQLLDSLSENWMEAGLAEVGGVVYQTYVSGSNELLIEQNIQVSLM